ncbi:MAG: DUF3846 domain-containing protein, partial [Firmicutes bacterium]|nr:DUF3846 domain-containing protein [Bacillota bacterium]
MEALRKMPGGTWQMIEIANTLEALQEQVGGYIEAVTLATDACLLCDEEGRIKGRPINYAFGRMF